MEYSNNCAQQADITQKSKRHMRQIIHVHKCYIQVRNEQKSSTVLGERTWVMLWKFKYFVLSMISVVKELMLKMQNIDTAVAYFR